MRAIFVLNVWGELIHHTATSEGLAWTREASYCQNAAERLLGMEGHKRLKGASLGRVVWGRQRSVSSKVLLGPRHWAGSSYSELSMHQLKFGPCGDWVYRRWCEGLNAISMMSKTPSGSAPLSFHVIHWAMMATGGVQCQGMFCAKLLSAYKYLVLNDSSSFKLTSGMWKFETLVVKSKIIKIGIRSATLLRVR